MMRTLFLSAGIAVAFASNAASAVEPGSMGVAMCMDIMKADMKTKNVHFTMSDNRRMDLATLCQFKREAENNGGQYTEQFKGGSIAFSKEKAEELCSTNYSATQQFNIAQLFQDEIGVQQAHAFQNCLDIMGKHTQVNVTNFRTWTEPGQGDAAKAVCKDGLHSGFSLTFVWDPPSAALNRTIVRIPHGPNPENICTCNITPKEIAPWRELKVGESPKAEPGWTETYYIDRDRPYIYECQSIFRGVENNLTLNFDDAKNDSIFIPYPIIQ